MVLRVRPADGMSAGPSSDRDWQAVFEETYAGPPSRVAERVWRRVYGEEYPSGLDPFSTVTLSELRRFASELQVGKGQTVVDIGCGRGGPGLWIAAATGASLVGIDISSHALEAARRRADAMDLEERAEFRVGSFESTGLAAGSMAGLVSIDALLFAPDKAAALAELRRVARPGARLVFTSWDYNEQPVGRPPQVDDHRPLLEAAGFAVLAYEETEDWRRRATDTVAGLLENVEELAAEREEDVEVVRGRLKEMRATIPAMRRRVMLIAQARRP
jgi:SAM-dependent methyltransferase